jgi:anti-sigma regulatory factor (Ser/Thr protein kinase)
MSPDLKQDPQRTRRPLASSRGQAPDRVYVSAYAAVPESVREVRNAVVEFAAVAGANERTQEAIRLTASEAAANVVEHAYSDADGRIDVTAESLDADAIWVAIADNGVGLRFGNTSPGLGLGFIWMAWFSDGMTLTSSQTGGLEVILRFSLL